MRRTPSRGRCAARWSVPDRHPIHAVRRVGSAIRRRFLSIPGVDALRETVPATAAVKAMEALPLAAVNALTRGRPLLILAPHPDDESIGCGGTIAAARAAGVDVHVLILTDGAASHPGSSAYPPARLRSLRESEARAAVDCLGVPPDNIRFFGLPDGAAPHDGPGFAAAARGIIRIIEAHGVATVATTSPYDRHPDHRACFRMALAACEATSTRLYHFPIWNLAPKPAERVPRGPICGFRVAIGDQLPHKRRAIAAYRSQIGTLIDDDPSGFRLHEEFLRLFDRPYEIFVESGISHM